MGPSCFLVFYFSALYFEYILILPTKLSSLILFLMSNITLPLFKLLPLWEYSKVSEHLIFKFFKKENFVLYFLVFVFYWVLLLTFCSLFNFFLQWILMSVCWQECKRCHWTTILLWSRKWVHQLMHSLDSMVSKKYYY